ncbi:MAG: hypothetical protein FGM40_08800, partial [Rhodocyclaceae bacterium]|nr:hypothetical protein [Rhodocyclaceae bacterium]
MPADTETVFAESSCGLVGAGSSPGDGGGAGVSLAAPYPDRWVARSAAGALDEAARRAHNAAFEHKELARHGGFFETLLPQPLNHEQRAAIVVDEDATLVVAAAGSGKTTLLLGKIGYLVMRGLARPREIALLAFNNSVRAEIRERLAASHPGVAVHTFHSLGLEIVRAAADGACRLSDMATDNERLRAFVADALLAIAEREPGALADWLTAQFRPLRDRSDFASEREYKAWARRNPPVTLLGPRAASEPLREVADRLALAGIRYRLDAALPILPAWTGVPPYRPQLSLPDARVVVDLAGADGGAGRGRGTSGPGWAARLLQEGLAGLACLRHGYRRVWLSKAGALQREDRLGAVLADRLASHGLDLAPRALRMQIVQPSAKVRLDDTAALLATCITLHKG